MQDMIVVFVCLLTGGLGAWIIQKMGYKLGVVDIPNARSSHNNTIPKGGGIGILAAFVLCAFMLGFSKTFWLSGLVLSIVSFVGDRLDIKPKFRLIVQFGCGLVFLIGAMGVYDTNVLTYFLIIPVILFIVGTANFYNFMDGINGIAGITGLVGFLLLAIYGHGSGVNSKYIVLAISMACACAGFLPFNIPKARVFMGDVGSVLLGFVFACLVVKMSRTLLDFMCMAAFLFPFYVDELTTMAMRIRQGDRLTEPHRKHLYQLLANEFGIEHWKVSVSYCVGQLIVGMVLIGLKPYGYGVVITFMIICLLLFSIASTYVRLKSMFLSENHGRLF